MACKHGYLKSPRAGRRCRKAPRNGSYRSRSRSRSRRPRGGCKYGMLKNPTGRRRCRKAPRGTSRRRTSSYRSRRKPAGMAKRGSRCTSFRRVRVHTRKGIRMQRRCKNFRAR